LQHLSQKELRSFLDFKYRQYIRPGFITSDPVSISHLFISKENIEISAFLTAIISWGYRISILQNAKKLMELMDIDPYGFIISFTSSDLKPFRKFVNRIFNGKDCIYFLRSLQKIYSDNGRL